MNIFLLFCRLLICSIFLNQLSYAFTETESELQTEILATFQQNHCTLFNQAEFYSPASVEPNETVLGCGIVNQESDIENASKILLKKRGFRSFLPGAYFTRWEISQGHLQMLLQVRCINQMPLEHVVFCIKRISLVSHLN